MEAAIERESSHHPDSPSCTLVSACAANSCLTASGELWCTCVCYQRHREGVMLCVLCMRVHALGGGMRRTAVDNQVSSLRRAASKPPPPNRQACSCFCFVSVYRRLFVCVALNLHRNETAACARFATYGPVKWVRLRRTVGVVDVLVEPGDRLLQLLWIFCSCTQNISWLPACCAVLLHRLEIRVSTHARRGSLLLPITLRREYPWLTL